MFRRSTASSQPTAISTTLVDPEAAITGADRFGAQARGIGSDLARRVGGTPVVLRETLHAKVMETLESFNRGNPRNFLFSTGGRRLLGFEAASARAWQLAPEAEGPSGAGLDALWDDIRRRMAQPRSLASTVRSELGQMR